MLLKEVQKTLQIAELTKRFQSEIIDTSNRDWTKDKLLSAIEDFLKKNNVEAEEMKKSVDLVFDKVKA